MNKVVAKRSTSSFWALLLLVGGLLIGASSAQAQGTFGAPDPNEGIKTLGTWVAPAIALNILNTEMTGIEGTMSNLNSDSPAFKKLKIRHLYYGYIFGGISEGLTVPKSIVLSTNKIGAEIQPDTPGAILNNAELESMKNDVVNLLQN